MLAKPGSITPHTEFEAQVYVLSKEEGGRHTPFFKGYRPQFYFRTTDVTGAIELPEGMEMIMPGDNTTMTVDLIAPIAMEEGLRFAIREGGRTVGAGRVVKIIKLSQSAARTRGEATSSGGPEDPDQAAGVRPRDARRRGAGHRGPRDPDRGEGGGPVPLPTERSVYTVIRAPHKDKDSREHFQMLTHKRLIDIVDATSKTVQELQRLNLSAGVDIEIKL